MQRAGVPVVTIDRRVQDFTGDTVTVDNPMVGRLAAEHLLEEGCRQPAVVSGPATVSSTRDRQQEFCRVFAEAGLPIPPGRLLHQDLRARNAESAVVGLLRSHPEIDAIFSTNGPLTSSTFLALRDEGRLIPGEVALVGVDDDHWTRMVTPQVSVVAQPINQLGAWAGQLLTARARNQELEHARVMLDPVLQVRGSSLRSR